MSGGLAVPTGQIYGETAGPTFRRNGALDQRLHESRGHAYVSWNKTQASRPPAPDFLRSSRSTIVDLQLLDARRPVRGAAARRDFAHVGIFMPASPVRRRARAGTLSSFAPSNRGRELARVDVDQPHSLAQL